MASLRRPVFVLQMLVTTALMGSSFAVGKIGLADASPLLLAGVRFTLAGTLFALIVIMAKRPHPKLGGDWVRIALVGLFQTAGVMGCIFIGLRTIPAGESSILTFINPLLVVLFEAVFLGTRYRQVQWAGVILGFLGVSMTFGFDLRLSTGTWVTLAGAVSWAIATVLIHRFGSRFDIWVLTAYQMLFGGVALLIASAALERPTFTLTPPLVLVVLWLALMGSIVQFALWFLLLQHGNPGRTSAFLFLAPLFGVLFGWLLLHENVGWDVLAGGVLIFLGIFMVHWPAGRRLPPLEAEPESLP